MEHTKTTNGATSATNATNATNATPAPVEETTTTDESPATVEERAAEILAPFTKPRDLLQEWTKADTGAEFDKLQELAAADLAHFFGNSFKFTAGSCPRCGDDFRAYEVGELFGLPYTSSGCEFGAVWNTNTQAQTRAPLPALFFKGIAIQPRPAAKYKKFDFVYVFMADTDAGEVWHYFTAEEFLTVKAQLGELRRAARLSEFVASVNAITPRAVEVLRAYNGKKCGEKTREKIRAGINAITEETAPRVRLWLDFSQYSPALVFSFGYNEFEKRVYLNFYDSNTNTITTPDEIPAPVKEFDPVKILDTLKEKATNAERAAAVLLAALEEYNDAAHLLHLPTIPTTGANVSALAKYGATSAARN